MPLSLGRVFSSIMFVADDITNELDCQEDGLIFFSSCKVLLIDHDNMVPYERNDRNFIDFDKPKGCETDSLVVYGIFKSIIIMSPSENLGVCYLLTYNKSMQLSFFKRIDFTASMNCKIAIEWHFGVAIIPHIGKMFLMTRSNSFLVLDMRTFQVSQVLLSTLPISPGACLKRSKQNRMINIIYSNYHSDQHLYLKYALYKGQTLKNLALHAALEDFSVEKI